MVEQRFCPQHYGLRPIGEFVGKKGGLVNWCEGCRNLYRNGGTALTRRARLDAVASSRVLWVPKSGDRKLGGIPATYSAGSTCPDACSLKDKGCYAEFGKLQFHWRRVPERGLDWLAFAGAVRALPEGQLWRHNIAGDLPGNGDKLDTGKLASLVFANSGRRGFSFTHKPLRSARERRIVSAANELGFTINLSADSIEDADRLAALGIAPVAVVLSSDSPIRGLKTPSGRTIVVCPAETHGLTCATCQLCAQPQRKAIVGFRAHGQWNKRIDARLRLPVVQEAHG